MNFTIFNSLPKLALFKAKKIIIDLKLKKEIFKIFIHFLDQKESTTARTYLMIKKWIFPLFLKFPKKYNFLTQNDRDF